MLLFLLTVLVTQFKAVELCNSTTILDSGVPHTVVFPQGAGFNCFQYSHNYPFQPSEPPSASDFPYGFIEFRTNYSMDVYLSIGTTVDKLTSLKYKSGSKSIQIRLSPCEFRSLMLKTNSTVSSSPVLISIGFVIPSHFPSGPFRVVSLVRSSTPQAINFDTPVTDFMQVCKQDTAEEYFSYRREVEYFVKTDGRWPRMNLSAQSQAIGSGLGGYFLVPAMDCVNVPGFELGFPGAKHMFSLTSLQSKEKEGWWESAGPLSTSNKSVLAWSSSNYWLLRLQRSGFNPRVYARRVPRGTKQSFKFSSSRINTQLVGWYDAYCPDPEDFDREDFEFTLSVNEDFGGGTKGSGLDDWDVYSIKAEKDGAGLFVYMFIAATFCAIGVAVQCVLLRRMAGMKSEKERENAVKVSMCLMVVVMAFNGLASALNVGILGAERDIGGDIVNFVYGFETDPLASCETSHCYKIRICSSIEDDGKRDVCFYNEFVAGVFETLNDSCTALDAKLFRTDHADESTGLMAIMLIVLGVVGFLGGLWNALPYIVGVFYECCPCCIDYCFDKLNEKLEQEARLSKFAAKFNPAWCSILKLSISLIAFICCVIVYFIVDVNEFYVKYALYTDTETPELISVDEECVKIGEYNCNSRYLLRKTGTDVLSPFNRTSCEVDASFWLDEGGSYELAISFFAVILVFECVLLPMQWIMNEMTAQLETGENKISHRQRNSTPARSPSYTFARETDGNSRRSSAVVASRRSHAFDGPKSVASRSRTGTNSHMSRQSVRSRAGTASRTGTLRRGSKKRISSQFPVQTASAPPLSSPLPENVDDVAQQE